MLPRVNRPLTLDNDDVIDVGQPPKRRRWRGWIILAILLVLFALSRSLSIFLSAAWFNSLGFSAVYWYIFKLKLVLFIVFAIITIAFLRLVFWLLEKTFARLPMQKRTIFVNKQPVQFAPERLLKPAGWIIAALFGLFYAFAMKAEWQTFALYFNQAAAAVTPDPVFQKPLGFYLFSLPVYDLISSWAIVLAFIVLCATIAFVLLTAPQKLLKPTRPETSGRGWTAMSIALALFLCLLAWRTYLSRFPHLWQDHQIFTGVTYTEENYLLPALSWVAIALLLAAVLALLNAFTKRSLRLLLLALAIPLFVYVVGVYLVPAYVNSFIVKPNELGREGTYIDRNITWTRRAFGLEQVELRDFDVNTGITSNDLTANAATLDNIRLWDWHALKDTLKQIQAIRTYYDFSDVDVDRYRVDTVRQMMVAARELDLSKLPDVSRNWINEKLIYTHGYGVTVNTANGFTPEGMPRFIVSDMPVQSNSPAIKVTRPEIYFGQETDTDVYVKTKQKEFDFPQGEQNTYTNYAGSGGIPIGGRFRRLLLAWALGDVAKLPFSDDVSPDSRVLIHRNIRELVNGIAPFLIYDNDPYIVISDEGRLFWMIDAFTESATYPYSRHHDVAGNDVNYVRNSVKVVIDAYNGTATFYVFDSNDPLIATYRATFPSLFQDASQMPADLRAHVRYPETLIRVQGEVYGLYHTTNSRVFFQREDVWNVAQQVTGDNQSRKPVPIDPYFVLMQLPGEQTENEFVLILPFTPAGRNNLIGWMAGRCDGDNYGKLLIYNFPKSRLTDGPLQIEARIDQNSQLSAQFTLWNQQGSHVLRGHLLVIPIGRSLLYVEPIYLKAESSPMPELRLVVLATQDRLGYGQTFDEAKRNIFGDLVEHPTAETPPKAGSPQPSPTETASPTNESLASQIDQANKELEEYQRLTSQGKFAEGGKKLEDLKRHLDALQKAAAAKKP